MGNSSGPQLLQSGSKAARVASLPSNAQPDNVPIALPHLQGTPTPLGHKAFFADTDGHAFCVPPAPGALPLDPPLLGGCAGGGYCGGVFIVIGGSVGGAAPPAGGSAVMTLISGGKMLPGGNGPGGPEGGGVNGGGDKGVSGPDAPPPEGGAATKIRPGKMYGGQPCLMISWSLVVKLVCCWPLASV
jgi:hypothetical protein